MVKWFSLLNYLQSVDVAGPLAGVVLLRNMLTCQTVVTEMAPGIIAVDIRNTSQLMKSHWFGTAISNQGFMHSLLSTIALHRHVFGRGPIETVLYHRAHAIASVNTALANTDMTIGISDANIGAVFNLLSVEESLASPWFSYLRPHGDNPNQRAIHLNGLLRMIELRGGLMAMNSNRILQAFILWCVTWLPTVPGKEKHFSAAGGGLAIYRPVSVRRYWF